MRRTHTIQLDDRGTSHVHRCPECRQSPLCVIDCGTKYDLVTRGQVGDAQLCDECKWTQCPECHHPTKPYILGVVHQVTEEFDPKRHKRWCARCRLEFVAIWTDAGTQIGWFRLA